MCDLFLVRQLTPYHANVGQRLVKSPKVCVRDSGLVHALLGIVDAVDLLNNPIAGMSWEGFVIEELTSALPWPARAHFYRTQAGAEIDLVIEHRDLTTWAIEIKRSVAAPVTKGFHMARGDLNPDRSFVVYSGDSGFPLGDGIKALGARDRADLIAGTRP